MTSELLEKNRKAEIFSVPYAADEVEHLMDEKQEQIRGIAKEIHSRAPKRLILVGSGASWCTLYTGQYLMDCYSTLPCEIYCGPEFDDRQPAFLNEKAFAILASYSGKTADTLRALEILKQNNVSTLGISRDKRGPLSQRVDMLLTYESGALYTSPMAEVVMLLVELMRLRGESLPECEKLTRALRQLPSNMRLVLAKSEEMAIRETERFKEDPLLYMIAGGALTALGYQYAYTTIMEYLRTDAIYLHPGEFRHGPLEIIGDGQPAMIHLIGYGTCRDYSLMTYEFCNKHGARTLSLDAADYFQTHPVLSPFVLFPVLQYLLLYMAQAKNIDLDEYLHMHVVSYTEGETYF